MTIHLVGESQTPKRIVTFCCQNTRVGWHFCSCVRVVCTITRSAASWETIAGGTVKRWDIAYSLVLCLKCVMNEVYCTQVHCVAVCSRSIWEAARPTQRERANERVSPCGNDTHCCITTSREDIDFHHTLHSQVAGESSLEPSAEYQEPKLPNWSDRIKSWAWCWSHNRPYKSCGEQRRISSVVLFESTTGSSWKFSLPETEHHSWLIFPSFDRWKKLDLL